MRSISAPVETFDDALRDLSASMYETIAKHRALGLAAVQVGQPIRLILVSDGAGHIIAMANPKLLRTLNRFEVREEGCLSVVGRVRVSRPAKCEVEWQDLEGNRKQGNFAGLAARVIQHEMDHLEGVLITDRRG